MNEKNHKICSRCVMDTTDPQIVFDDNGVCNHCLGFDEFFKHKWFPNNEGKEKLDRIIEDIIKAGKGREYDCIIGLSGGVDSSYLAYILRKEYPELRILAIHVDAGWNSELAVHNIENIVKNLEIDLHTVVMDWEEMKDLQRAYFQSQLANQDVPQDHAFFANLYDVSTKLKIKYFLSGGNIATESILPSAWVYNASDGKQLKAVHKQFGHLKLKHYKTISFFKKYIYYPYIKRLKIVRPLDYYPYDKDKAKLEIMAAINWRDYGGKHHESIFTKFYQSYWLPKKFGYDKRRAHFSSLIVAGLETRENSLSELTKPPYQDSELIDDQEYMAKKLGMSVGEFNELMAMPNKNFEDYPSNAALLGFVKKIAKLVK